MAVSRRKKRRKSNTAAVYIPLAAILVSTLTVLGVSVFLRIIEIEVIGAEIYGSEQLINASGISIGDNLLFLDASAAEQMILSAMPYINEVIIEYSLPDKVLIRVSEATAIATVDYLGGVSLIDYNGRVLEHMPVKPAGLIEIRGFTPADASEGSMLRPSFGDDTRLRYLTEMLTAFEREGIQDQVTILDISNIAFVSFVLNDRFTVIVGTTDNVRSKLSSLPEIIADIETREPRGENWTIHMTDREPWRFSPDR